MPETGVDDERDEVGGRELPRSEDIERQHRVPATPLHGDEAGERGQADSAGRQHARRRAALAGLNERPGHSGQPHDSQHRAGDVDAADGGGIARLGNVADRHGNHRDRQRHVDQEDQTPRPHADEPPADKRPDRRGDSGQPRPCADRSSAVTGCERGLKDREAAWREQRASDALERAGGHECLGRGREAAEQRRGSEPHDSEQEDPADARIGHPGNRR